ncbi:MAG: thioredoxin family protein [Acidobacteriota bacterium]
MIRTITAFFIFFTLLPILNISCSSGSKKGDGSEKVDPDIKVTFVELGSVRCIPCKKMQPIMDEIEKEYEDQVKVVFHDVRTSEGKPFAGKYKIRLIPTQIFLDAGGKEYFRHEGFFPKKEIVKILKLKGVE